MTSSVSSIEQAFLEALQGKPDALAEHCLSPNFLERLSVYETSIVSTLQQTLYKTFRPLEALLGREAFQELCFRYASTHFSREFNLNRYGDKLSTFAMTAPYAKDLLYLGEFIQFCYLWQQTYLHPEAEATMHYFTYPVYEIWERCQPEFHGDKAIPDWQGPFIYRLWRQADKVIVEKKPA